MMTSRRLVGQLLDLRKIRQHGYLNEIISRHEAVRVQSGIKEADRQYGRVRKNQLLEPTSKGDSV
jgi:hypothetical protein